MAENSPVPNRETVEAFSMRPRIEGWRADAKAPTTLMEEATGEEATMWGPAIAGFGRYRYKY